MSLLCRSAVEGGLLFPMRHPFTLATWFITVSALAQTGPGGVGNSASNVLWLRADNGVSVAGTAVTTWADRSGNGHVASPPGATAQPACMAGAVNGLPAVSFDGTDDQLHIPDAASLDLTQWDLFMVAAESAPKANNCWLSKGSSTQPDYAMWSDLTGAVNMPIYSAFWGLNPASTAAGVTNAAFNVLQYRTPILGFGRVLYKNAAVAFGPAWSPLLVPAVNNQPLCLGSTSDASGWFLNGRMAELILYNAPVNTAQQIIVENYLAAKYGTTLTTMDLYVQDNAANGNYDFDVAGIGSINIFTMQADSRGSGIVRINNPLGLGDNEFLFWGHDNGALSTLGVTDFPASVQARWARVWRVSEVRTSGAAADVGSVNITFDLTNQGPVTAGQLRLLVDMDNDGFFADETPIPATAVAVGGNQYRFNGVTALANNRRFTLATTDLLVTPLPIELLAFTAEARPDGTVQLAWSTASEQGNALFTVERSTDAQAWEDVASLPGAGNSTQPVYYQAVDQGATGPLIYYRLRQTDQNGATSWSSVVPVRLPMAETAEPLVFPNPSQGPFQVSFPGMDGVAWIELLAPDGRLVRDLQVQRTGIGTYLVDPGPLPKGIYVLRAHLPGGEALRPVQVLR
jgi:hypothetical protein